MAENLVRCRQKFGFLKLVLLLTRPLWPLQHLRSFLLLHLFLKVALVFLLGGPECRLFKLKLEILAAIGIIQRQGVLGVLTFDQKLHAQL